MRKICGSVRGQGVARKAYLAGWGCGAASEGSAKRAERKMAVKRRFAAAMLRRKTHEGMAEPVGPVQRDWTMPWRFFG